MADISAKFKNHYGESASWTIRDYGRDQDNPKIVFSDYLDADAETDWLALQERGDISYQRSSGSEFHISVSDGSTVDMD